MEVLTFLSFFLSLRWRSEECGVCICDLNLQGRRGGKEGNHIREKKAIQIWEICEREINELKKSKKSCTRRTSQSR